MSPAPAICGCYPANDCCPSAVVCPDREQLVRFVVWNIRAGDLPEDVRVAALRLAPGYPREGQNGYLERHRPTVSPS